MSFFRRSEFLSILSAIGQGVLIGLLVAVLGYGGVFVYANADFLCPTGQYRTQGACLASKDPAVVVELPVGKLPAPAPTILAEKEPRVNLIALVVSDSNWRNNHPVEFGSATLLGRDHGRIELKLSPDAYRLYLRESLWGGFDLGSWVINERTADSYVDLHDAKAQLAALNGGELPAEIAYDVRAVPAPVFPFMSEQVNTEIPDPDSETL
jgi:hypothetical protein